MSASPGHRPQLRPSGPRPNWFVGLPLPASAGWGIGAESLGVTLRPLASDDLHITVAFLGACGEARALSGWRALAPLRHPPIAITARAWRGFGPRRNPSAFGLTLDEGEPRLVEMIRRWREAILRAAGRPPDGRDPLPHVTLARPPRRSGAAERSRIGRLLVDLPVPPDPIVLASLALYTWADDRRQRQFRVVVSRPLDGAHSSEAGPGTQPP